MKWTSIDGIERWYGNSADVEEWDTVLKRAKEDWKAEMIQAYKSGVEHGMQNGELLIKGLERTWGELKGEFNTLPDSEVWFENNWRGKRN